MLWYILYILVIIFLIKGYYKSIVQRITAWILNRFKGFINRHAFEQKVQLFTSLKNKKSTKRGGKLQILEIGAGSGANFVFFPSGSEIVCLEPNPHCKAYIEENAASNEIHLKNVLCEFGETMKSVGLEDNSFDAVICTFVFCSVKDVNQVLSEVKRVLKPDGTLYFMEHIHKEHGIVLDTIHQLFYPACRHTSEITKDIPYIIRQAGFDMEVHNFEMRSFILPCFKEKCYFGTATIVD